MAQRIRGTPLPRTLIMLLLAVAVCAPLALYRVRLAKPTMSWDDFPFVRDAVTWERTRAALTRPFATHFCPPFRLLTWALVAQAGQLSAIPETLRVGWICAHVLIMLTLYEFVSRETHSPVSGVAAVMLVGLTTSYFPVGVGGLHACSLYLWSMAFALMALLCLQCSRESPRWGSLVCAGLLAALAASWVSAGLVAGPLGSLYVLLNATCRLRRRVLMAAIPMLGTCVFALLALALGRQELLNPENFAGRPVWEAFRPDIAVYLTARVVTEHLLSNLSIHRPLSVGQFLVFFCTITVSYVYWFRRARYQNLAICGLFLMLGSYMLVYSFRSYMDMSQVRQAQWYLFFPHVGWAVFLCAGIKQKGRSDERPVTLADATGLVGLGLALFLLHAPVAGRQAEGLISSSQLEQLSRLELIEQVSRRWDVDRQTLEEAIGPFPISGGGTFDGLSLIDPPREGRQWNLDDVRRGLEAVMESGSADAFEQVSGEEPLK